MSKLYLFYDVLQDYTPGIAGALAKNKKEAIDIILNQFNKDKKDPNTLNHVGTNVNVDYIRLKKELKYCKKVVIVDCDEKFGFYIGGGS